MATAGLGGRIALVTGASRGIGRGIARALGELGAMVYVTGRTAGDGPLTIDETAKMVTEAGGIGLPVQVDHTDDQQIAELFSRIRAEVDHLDVLVNNAYQMPNPPVWGGGFWEHPLSIWDDQVGTGARCHYVASWHAAPLLFDGFSKLIVNISSPGALAYQFSATHGVGKTALDRLTRDMAIELAGKDVAVVGLYPGSVATEFVIEVNKERGRDLTKAQTPLFVGRAVGAIATMPDNLERTGQTLWVEDLAHEFGFVDEHGKQPPGYARRSSLPGGGGLAQENSP